MPYLLVESPAILMGFNTWQRLKDYDSHQPTITGGGEGVATGPDTLVLWLSRPPEGLDRDGRPR